MAKKKKKAPFPTPDQILEFIETAPGKVGKKEIANAFHIKGDERIRLKKILKKMKTEAKIAVEPGKALRPGGTLPNVLVVHIGGVDKYGELMAAPATWKGKDAPPRIFIAHHQSKKTPALARGDSALVRVNLLQDEEGDYYSAQIIRVLKGAPRTFIGVYRRGKDGGYITPTDRKNRNTFTVQPGNEAGAADNTLVLAEAGPKPRSRQGRAERTAKVLENLGDLSEPKSISLIAIHHHDIPYKFPPEVIREAEKTRPPSLKGRVDLRQEPFFTIDPADARDHDDAVLAKPDPDPKNPGGHFLSVAIADVGHYVRPGSALDLEAEKRGNSCYFPDRVVPMLPEALSADLCSLVKGKERAVFVCHIKINAGGDILNHRFERAIIKCLANLSYQEIQAEIDAAKGQTWHLTKPLYDAFRCLLKARNARGPLALNVPERKVILRADGTIEDIVLREVLTSHQIIEEFMIAANVAAARTLTKRNTLCMFRVHEEPSREKIENFRNFLQTLGLKFARGQALSPKVFNAVLAQVGNKKYRDVVHEMVLRSQSQAFYSPDNLGHFGLALSQYAHFTSPIRRYSDILVHRGLITALGLGFDGLKTQDINAFRKMAEDISNAERRAMAAERESTDRYLAAYMSDRLGETSSAKISGVTRFGLFAVLPHSGADGFIPMSSLAYDYFHYDDKGQRLIGRHTGDQYRLGDEIKIRLVEADKFTGSLRFELMHENAVPENLLRPANRRGQRKKGRRR
ncbi:MAG TPA: ribonuclease R, partial [Sphingomonadales bacterium]|nr:ribonuclease R [Sphingomonadales bacterium]